MSNSNNGGALVAVMWIVTVILTIFAGIISWNWVDPDGFMELIGFLLIWSVLSSVGHVLAIGLAALIERMF
jgi:hypothetical protein